MICQRCARPAMRPEGRRISGRPEASRRERDRPGFPFIRRRREGSHRIRSRATDIIGYDHRRLQRQDLEIEVREDRAVLHRHDELAALGLHRGEVVQLQTPLFLPRERLGEGGNSIAEIVVIGLVRGAEHSENTVGGEEAEESVEGSEEEDRFLVRPSIEKRRGAVGGMAPRRRRGFALGGPTLDDGRDMGTGAWGEDDVDDEGLHDAVLGVVEGRGKVAKGEVEPPVALAGAGDGGGGGAAVEVGDPGAKNGVEGLEIKLDDDLLGPVGFRHDWFGSIGNRITVWDGGGVGSRGRARRGGGPRGRGWAWRAACGRSGGRREQGRDW